MFLLADENGSWTYIRQYARSNINGLLIRVQCLNTDENVKYVLTCYQIVSKVVQMKL